MTLQQPSNKLLSLLTKIPNIVWGMLLGAVLTFAVLGMQNNHIGFHLSPPFAVILVLLVILAIYSFIHARNQRRQATRTLKESNKLLELLSVISSAANNDISPEDYIQFSLEQVCHFMGWPVGHVFHRAIEDDTLTSANWWMLSDAEYWQPFKDATSELVLSGGPSIIGRAEASGEVIWVENVGKDKHFKRESVAKQLGLKTACALPILVNGSVVYVLEFYTKHQIKSSPNAKQTLSQIAHHVSRAVSRKQMEAELKESARRFEAIFNQSFQFIGLMTPEGVLMEANRSALEASGVKEDDVLGKPFWLSPWWNHSDDMQNRLKEGIRKAAAGKFVRFEAHHPTPDGQYITVDFSIKPVFNDDGMVTLLIPEGRDITYTKEVEKSLISAREAALAASRAKSQFLANMTHEIRTPLNAIIGFTQLLLGKNLTEDVRDDVEVLESAGSTLLSLVNDILDLSKAESGKLTLELIPFDLEKKLKDLASTFQYQSSEAVKFIVDMDGIDSTHLIGDGDRIRQILTNFLSNAFKFTKAGTITLKATSSLPEDGISRVIIDVVDTGKGIDEEKLELIFEEFTQEDISTTRQYGGTGLGLSISKQLADLMDGRIRVKSSPGQGSTFTFSVPLPVDMKAVQVTPQVNEEQLPVIDYSNVSVLLVEDNLLNQKVAQRLLEKVGVTVDVANNGLEALDKLANKSYNIVFMDCQMPEMDGFEATRTLRRRSFKTPVIALTANATGLERDRCIAAGMDAFMTKPVQRDELQAAINHWALPSSPKTAGVPHSFLDRQQGHSDTG